jgi:protoheme IX farnesyltransferase
MQLHEYYRLVKPGEVYGNSLTALAGFFLGSHGKVLTAAFPALLFGLALVMAGCLVINNWIDREIDSQMERTKSRALAQGSISSKNALVFAAALLVGGFGLLAFTNLVTIFIVVVGLIDYVVLYSLAKRRTTWSTVIGSVSGAVPVVAGYTAATGRLDLGAWLVFAVMTIWQMPHFYSIGIFRQSEYAAAGLPILPVKIGAARTRYHILAYVLAYLPVVLLLSYFGYTGNFFAGVMAVMSVYWIWQAITGSTADYSAWARKNFGVAMVVLLGFCVMLVLNPFLP